MSNDEVKESPKEKDNPIADADTPPCEPCETVHSISVLCNDLGRDDDGYMACRTLTQDVADGKLDPERYYLELIEKYGRERVEKAAMHAFLDAEVSGGEKEGKDVVAERRGLERPAPADRGILGESVPEPAKVKPKEEPADVPSVTEEEKKEEVIEDMDEAFKSLSSEDKIKFMKMLREGK